MKIILTGVYECEPELNRLKQCKMDIGYCVTWFWTEMEKCDGKKRGFAQERLRSVFVM